MMRGPRLWMRRRFRILPLPARNLLDLYTFKQNYTLNPLNAELNPICHLLALLGAHPILHVSRIRVNVLTTYHSLQIQDKTQK
jgi:hypothetical protein